MKVEVKLLSDKGRAVPKAMMPARQRFTGAFSLLEVRSKELGRSCFMANLLPTSENGQDPVLPPLHDATLIHAEAGRMRVRGFEFLDGMQVGQTWDVKVLSC